MHDKTIPALAGLHRTISVRARLRRRVKPSFMSCKISRTTNQIILLSGRHTIRRSQDRRTQSQAVIDFWLPGHLRRGERPSLPLPCAFP